MSEAGISYIDGLISRIDQVTVDFRLTFGSISPEALNQKPDPETWSIAQNMDHLIAINESYFPIFKDLKEGTFKPPFISKFGFLVSFFGNAILKSVRPENVKKNKTLSIWEPSTSQIDEDILNRFIEHQAILKEQIESLSEFSGKGMIISSPANRNFVYKLDTALDIIVTHEQRHFNQARSVLELITNDQ
jgi:hypothetical protein